MEAVIDGRDWELTARIDGSAVRTVPARDLFRQIAHSAWECADPGLQYDTTINRWHTAPETGRINGSNPCSRIRSPRQLSLQSGLLNLLTFLDEDDEFDVEGFKAGVAIMFTAQEILVGNADYPTEKIGETTRAFRELGIGYANLGALLMAQGLPYDSDAGRAWAAAITALLTGHAYATSARTAARMGPFAGFHDNADAMLNVLRMHRDEAAAHRRGSRSPGAAVGGPGVLGRRGGVGRAVRRAQLASQRVGADRDHRPAHGLRHHRGRARPRTGQDQEAGRRGHHVDRQPDDPAGPDQAGLRPRSGRRDRGLHQRAHVDRRRTPCRSRAPGRVRLFHGRQHHPLLGPHPHDGCGPALHQRCHLQDGQPARGRLGRGRRAAAHRRLAARRQGRCHLPGQLQGGPAAVDHQDGEHRGHRRWRRGPGGIGGRSPGPGHRRPHRRAGDGAGARAPAQDRVGGRRRRAGASAPPSQLQDVRLPGGRLRGLRDRRRVRGRAARARSSSTSPSRVRPWPASWTPSPSR